MRDDWQSWHAGCNSISMKRHTASLTIKGDHLIEQWKATHIASFNYEVSNLGRVRNRTTGTILKAAPKGNNYRKVGLKDSTGKRITCRVHRLVMAAFRCESKYPVNHIDGNKGNNKLENLEYCTPAQNTAHAIELGLRK
jgi:hypothetical protein